MVSSTFSIKAFLLTIFLVIALLPHQTNAKLVAQKRQAVATIQNNWVTVCAPGTGDNPNFTNNLVVKRDNSTITLNMNNKPTRTVDCSTATATATATATSQPDNNPPPKPTNQCDAQCWSTYLWSKL
jgi:hypothetical protein